MQSLNKELHKNKTMCIRQFRQRAIRLPFLHLVPSQMHNISPKTNIGYKIVQCAGYHVVSLLSKQQSSVAEIKPDKHDHKIKMQEVIL